jgi:Rrf2 family cysteine metabolism transcriptional repressor
VKGGYSFARPPEELTVLEVVEALEGALGAEATGVFADAVGAMRAQLEAVTIAEVAQREAKAAGAAMYYI